MKAVSSVVEKGIDEVKQVVEEVKNSDVVSMINQVVSPIIGGEEDIEYEEDEEYYNYYDDDEEEDYFYEDYQEDEQEISTPEMNKIQRNRKYQPMDIFLILSLISVLTYRLSVHFS